jgi:hypothetical protein
MRIDLEGGKSVTRTWHRALTTAGPLSGFDVVPLVK